MAQIVINVRVTISTLILIICSRYSDIWCSNAIVYQVT